MNQGKRLIKNTIIYAIGNIGAKILSYVMVLFYSYYIDTSDLGYYDIIITSISMLQPIIMLEINSGIFRFLLGSEEGKRDIIISSGFKFLLFTVVISEAIALFFLNIYDFKYSYWVALYFVGSVFFLYFQECIRGLGNNKLYAWVGVISSFLMLCSEIICLLVLKLGVLSLLISKIFSFFGSIIIMMIFQKELRTVWKKQQLDKSILRSLLRYSLPIVPTTICWWVVNSSDRYIIRYYLSEESNGIYSMSNKFPIIITSITGIFYLAWQESALREYNTENRDAFFSDVFNKYSTLLLTLCICAIPTTKIVMVFLLSDSYKMAWEYTGFLFLSVVFSSLCSFLGLGYQIAKETSRCILSTILTAIVNIFINVLLVKKIGLQAASFSTFVAFAFLFIVRIIHTRRYFKLSVKIIKFVLLIILCLLSIAITYYNNNVIYMLLQIVISCIVLVICNRSILLKMIKRNNNVY